MNGVVSVGLSIDTVKEYNYPLLMNKIQVIQNRDFRMMVMANRPVKIKEHDR